MAKRIILSTFETQLASQAKRVNQRMRRLEKAGKTFDSKAYQGILAKSFASKQGLFSITKNGELKVRTDISKLTDKQQKELAAIMSQFECATTSTVKGVKAYEKKIQKLVDIYNKKYGTNIDQDDFGKMWASSIMQKLKNDFGSDVALEVKGSLDSISNLSEDDQDEIMRKLYELGYGREDMSKAIEEIQFISTDEVKSKDARTKELKDYFDSRK